MNEAQELEADALISQAIRLLYPEMPLVTDWAIVLEGTDADGSPCITAKAPRGSTPWKTKGLFWYALHDLEPADDDD